MAHGDDPLVKRWMELSGQTEEDVMREHAKGQAPADASIDELYQRRTAYLQAEIDLQTLHEYVERARLDALEGLVGLIIQNTYSLLERGRYGTTFSDTDKAWSAAITYLERVESERMPQRINLRPYHALLRTHSDVYDNRRKPAATPEKRSA